MRRGRKGGHEGVTRPLLETWDAEEKHTASCFPHCDASVKPVNDGDGSPKFRIRYVEDVVLGESSITRHEIGLYWCRECDRRFEPAVVDALPRDRFGVQLLTLTAIQHNLYGITVSKVVELLGQQHGIKVSSGALVKGWQRIAERLDPEY